MRRITILRACIVALALTAAYAGAPGALAQEAVRIGTSAVGSSLYVVGIGMSKMIQEKAGINSNIEPLGGSHANMFGLERKNIELAIANSGAAYDRYMGIAPFKSRYPIRLLAQGQSSFRWMLVRKGSGISKPEDLVGKTIAANRKPLPEVALVASALLKEFGIAKNRLRIVSTADLEAENRGLRTGTISAAVMPFSLSQPVTVKLFSDGVVEPLIISRDRFDAIKSALPDIFYTQVIRANHYKNQPEAFPVLAMKILLAAGASLSEDAVYKVTKAIMGHHDEFAKIHASARAWTVKNTLAEPKIPFHPGAIRYYKEIGAWNAEMDAVQNRLLAR